MVRQKKCTVFVFMHDTTMFSLVSNNSVRVKSTYLASA